jgi:hypothetical protein
MVMSRVLSALFLVALAQPARADATGKYYVVVRGVEEAEHAKSGMVDELKKLFVDEIKRHPEFTLEAPPGLPTDPEAMSNELKKRKLRAFELTLKVLDVVREEKPPAPGKQYKTLVRGIKLSVFGDTLPEKVMAIGGDGESQVASELGAHEDVEKEGKSLLVDASKEAIKQAVDMTVTKLNLAGKPEKTPSKKKKKG